MEEATFWDNVAHFPSIPFMPVLSSQVPLVLFFSKVLFGPKKLVSMGIKNTVLLKHYEAAFCSDARSPKPSTLQSYKV